MTALKGWTFQVTADFSPPGWLHLPHDMTADERREWTETALDQLTSLIGTQRWDGTSTTNDHLRELLVYSLELESVVPAAATFVVWPLPGPAVLMCHLWLVSSGSVRRMLEAPEGVLHPVEAAHLGPGVQHSTRTTVDADDGEVDLYSVDLIFDDGEAAVVVSLEQSVAAMISNAFPGLAVLKDLIRVERPDGSQFASQTPTMIVDDAPWELMGS